MADSFQRFRFEDSSSMTSVLHHPKYLSRLWAALNVDFENLEKLFLHTSSWKFEDFAKCCRHQEITLIMHATLGRGKGSETQYNKTMSLILQTAKSMWLNPPDMPEDDHANKLLDLKRRTFGFFLTYLMYKKQPYKGRVKIVLGIKDLEMALIWKEQIKTIDVRDQIEFILQDLALGEAFQFQLTSAWCGFDAETRNVTAAAKSAIIPLTQKMKRIQDELFASGKIKEAQSVYANYQSTKMKLSKRMAGIGIFEADETQGTFEDKCTDQNDDVKTEDLVSKFYGGKKWQECIERLAKQADQPVITIPSLTDTEGIYQQMIMETKKRIARKKKKAIQVENDYLPKINNPYVNEGGIYARKKEVPEGEEGRLKKDRGICSGHLWTYINGKSFGDD